MPGVVLGEAGLAQAERLAERLAGQEVGAVYASPLERARMTAEPIARRIAQEVRVLEALNEIDFGEWSGRDFAALDGDPLWAAWNVARQVARPPGGESMFEAQARAVAGLDRLRREHGEARLALVSHSDLIKSVLAFVLGVPLDGLHRFDVDPASISTVVMGDWGAKVLSLNGTAGA